MVIVLGLLLGVVAGLRTMTAAAAASWAAYLGIAKVADTWLFFLGSVWTVAILTILALAELVTDQLPATPSRKVPVQFGARVVIGAIAGIVVAGAGSAPIGALAGAVGAVIGTLGGAHVRARLAASFGRDAPAALIEDAIAIVGAVLIVAALR